MATYDPQQARRAGPTTWSRGRWLVLAAVLVAIAVAVALILIYAGGLLGEDPFRLECACVGFGACLVFVRGEPLELPDAGRGDDAHRRPVLAVLLDRAAKLRPRAAREQHDQEIVRSHHFGR